MGWLDKLRGKVVGLDTAPLIYFIEDKPGYVDMVDPFFEAVENGEIAVVTSIVTLLEVLVAPIKAGDIVLARRYREILLDMEGLRTVDLSLDIIEEAAKLRAFHKLHTPDAIQMATAMKESAAFFLTNDIRLPSLPGLQMLKLDELRPN